MMRCLLSPNIALRSWRLVPYAYYERHRRNAAGLAKEEFELLSLCDGLHEMEESSLLSSLLKRGLAVPHETGGSLTEWQRPKYCDNRYFPAMNWMITGKCNYNCLHCFNASDNAPLMSEFSLEEAERLLEEAKECGINAFTITGGEPMLHKDFFDIIRGIYRRDMYVEELNTNGYFITEEALDRLKEIGCYPLMKISFDGIGYHDWLRNKKGAEEIALNAIRLCIDKGFQVKVQTNVHRKNIGCIPQTAELLDSLGVEAVRMIRTTEAPRWVRNAEGATLGFTEYYDGMLEFVKEYTKKPRTMAIDIWQFLSVYPQIRSYRIQPVECGRGEFRDSLPVCRGNRGMVAVAANGNVFPCHQMSGYYEGHGDIPGNVKIQGLKPLLQGGAYLSEVCTTVKELARRNEKCRNCSYFHHCAGGCRALALALTHDKLGCDVTKCEFYFNGYYEKITAALQQFDNLLPI